MCDMTSWYLWHEDVTDSYVRHDATHVWLQKTTNSKIEMFKKKIDWVFTTHCNTLQHTATAEKHEFQDRNVQEENRLGLKRSATWTLASSLHTCHCSTPQHTVTHCNTPQFTVLQNTAWPLAPSLHNDLCCSAVLQCVAVLYCSTVLQCCVAVLCCSAVLQCCVAMNCSGHWIPLYTMVCVTVLWCSVLQCVAVARIPYDGALARGATHCNTLQHIGENWSHERPWQD